ncbi:MAG: HAD family hydrolase [Desulfobacteraceae bacterium]|nr:MAG: HAD family hydrolase [Desulfobacteraceae bacterium]
MSALKAIFFDMDGVIIDTEKDGHRVAFNQTFIEFGFSFQWSVGYYHELLQISGGKERMRHDFRTRGIPELKSDQLDELIIKIHKRKTEIFISLIESGKLPLRPGIYRFMKEAMKKEMILGVCTTANERSASAVTKGVLADIAFDFVLAGDMVKKKKPDPEIYLMSLEKTGLPAESCIVVEDSRNGVTAAKSAGLNVIATTNQYTENEDLGMADIIVSCLGDYDGEKAVVKKAGKMPLPGGVVTVSQLIEYFSN